MYVEFFFFYDCGVTLEMHPSLFCMGGGLVVLHLKCTSLSIVIFLYIFLIKSFM